MHRGIEGLWLGLLNVPKRKRSSPLSLKLVVLHVPTHLAALPLNRVALHVPPHLAKRKGKRKKLTRLLAARVRLIAHVIVAQFALLWIIAEAQMGATTGYISTKC